MNLPKNFSSEILSNIFENSAIFSHQQCNKLNNKINFRFNEDQELLDIVNNE